MVKVLKAGRSYAVDLVGFLEGNIWQKKSVYGADIDNVTIKNDMVY